MAGTIVLPCNCKDEHQDKLYGVGRRLHNIGTKDKTKAYCTVCCPSQRSIRLGGGLRRHKSIEKKVTVVVAPPTDKPAAAPKKAA